jgi:hypothetical protein
MFFEFPTADEWRKLQETYPFDKLELSQDYFRYTLNPHGSIESFYAGSEIQTWTLHLQNRLIQTRWSYIFLMFHFTKGIPDDEWFISPGKNGESIQYYPHFEEKDHFTKAQFDYYADVFYYKLFSAWDTLGQILNVLYELEIAKPTFNEAVKKLKPLKPALHAKLKSILNSDDFLKMRALRHDITHNHLPGHIGSSVRKVSPTHFTFGGGSYTPSGAVQANVISALDMFADTLAAIKEQTAIDSAP